jgi:MYXO-CTERM domain-containing protein
MLPDGGAGGRFVSSSLTEPVPVLSLSLLVIGVAAPARGSETPAAPLDRLQTINRLVTDGRLAADLATTYRALAFTRPELLPPAIAFQPAANVDCATPAFVQAYQLRRRGGMSRAAAELYQYGSSRPASVGYYDSTIYPVRVHYTTAGLASQASSVVDYAEYAWQKQTQTMGFRPPLGDFGDVDQGGSTALDLYVGNAQGAGGFTAPEFDWGATAWTDCTTYIVISDQVTGAELQTTVAHELNHAMQAAYDCNEWVAFWENTSSYIMDLTYDNVNDYVYWLPEFQSVPGLPLERFDQRGAYQYGGMVIAATIDQALGSGNGTKLAEVWAKSQGTNAYQNSPSYFDAITQVVGNANGGMDAFQKTLTEWRYLTGSRDDRGHLHDAGLWSSICYPHGECQPPDDTTLALASLPASGTVGSKPHGHGSSYIRVNLGGSTSGILYTVFKGDPATRWGANIICWGSGSAEVTPLTVDVAGAGQVGVQVAGQDSCTLAVSALGPAAYNPSDEGDYDAVAGSTYSYTYGFDFTNGALTPPVIAGFAPSQVPCGGVNAVVIQGSGFWQGATVTADGGPVPITSVTGTAIVVTLPARANSGHVPIVVTNRDGQSAKARLIYVGDGCACDCDQRTVCEENCDCDPECLACVCDATDVCDADCDCDPDCDHCGCTPTAQPEPLAALMALALIAGALRGRRQRHC